MSMWTHVAGIIRLDTIESSQPLGRYSVEHAIEESFTCPPCGSEGELHVSYTRTCYGNQMPWGYVIIWGDLRDFGEQDEVQIIKDWIDRALRDLQDYAIMVRNQAVSILVEGEEEILWGTPQEPV